MTVERQIQFELTARSLVWFPAFYLLLATGYSYLKDGALMTFYIEHLTVDTAAFLINATDLIPMPVFAQGENLLAPFVTLSIRDGCDGIETMMLLWAAILATPARWYRLILALLASFIFVAAFNQIRIVVLLYTAIFHKNYFSLFHGIVAPVAMLIAATIVYLAWWRWSKPNSFHAS